MNRTVAQAKEELRREKLKGEEERVQFELRLATLEGERRAFQEQKQKIEEAAKRVNQQNYGQEKLIELEVKRRLQLALEE
jgi:hypothetical protein